MSVTYPVPSYVPLALLLKIVARAADGKTIAPKSAQTAIKKWVNSLATPDQIAMVDTSDDLEVDDVGAGVSASKDGFFIQTWTWVSTSP